MRSRLLFVAFVAALCAAAVPSVANAAPCYKRVIADWTKDGQINGHYSVTCLRKAYKKTPEDLADYSSILDDINAAIIAATAQAHSNGGGNGPGGGGSGGPNGSSPSGVTPSFGKNQAKQAAARARHAVEGAGTEASNPGHDKTVPLPLIVLGAVLAGGALLGASPALISRFRGRFPRVPRYRDSVRPPA
jgi:hypothetical protein